MFHVKHYNIIKNGSDKLMTTYTEILNIYENLTNLFLTNEYIELNNDCLITCELNVSNHLWFDITIQFDNDTKLCATVYSDNETYIVIYDTTNEIVNKYEYDNFDTDNLVGEIIKKIYKHSTLFFECL